MNKTDYLKFLQKQVREEIDYLTINGHDPNAENGRCVFCYEVKNNWRCDRQAQLVEFMVQINHQLSDRKTETSSIVFDEVSPSELEPVTF